MMDLGMTGKTVLVTGGSKGIGAGFCKAYARQGANVVVNFRSDPEGSMQFVDTLMDMGASGAVGIQADVSEEADVIRLYDEAIAAFGQVDILINNAASNKTYELLDISDEIWDYYMKANLTSAFLMCREFARRNIGSGRKCHIINILTKAAFLTTTKGRGCYAASKTGLLGFTRELAVELVEHNIYTNAIIPGFVRTPLTERLGEEFERKLHRLPMKRAFESDDLGDTAVFITSDQCDMMLGSVVDLSGGMMLGF
ncbi:SDR family oxidoreductase [Eubacteriales bacterium OttesenSCG-928-N14]|nr:SDR family oxidoreductase [Eubacteriales bacterium OttesenSCG-928-N14]